METGLDTPSRGELVLARLLASCQHMHPDRLGMVVDRELAGLDMVDVAVYLVDLDQRLLVPLGGSGLPERSSLEINTTLAGRAFRTGMLLEGSAEPVGDQVSDPGGPVVDFRPSSVDTPKRLWIPLIDGADRVGVLAVTVPNVDELTRRRAHLVAAVVAELVVTKSAFGDGLVAERRLRDVELAAELRWALLPPLTYVGDHVAISGLLEPAYEIAGDAFDYAVNQTSPTSPYSTPWATDSRPAASPTWR
jgi:hypothetical protein